MKSFASLSGLFATFLLTLGCLVLTPAQAQAQTIPIDSTFYADGEIFPFSPNDTIYGLSISGHVTLQSDTSLVRIIVTDNSGYEWMIYEAYPFIVSNTAFNIVDECDETCYLPGILPVGLKIQLWNSNMTISALDCDTVDIQNIDSLRTLSLKSRELLKISQMNSNLEHDEMLWRAGETILSGLTYVEKKKLFGDKYCLFGYDFYTGGLYSPMRITNSIPVESDLVDQFDWRNRHGANDSLKKIYYYDDDPDVYREEECEGEYYEMAEYGNGWMTAVKSQKINYHNTHEECKAQCVSTCYIYGCLGALEALVNLYYVRTDKGLDMSEQQVLDCENSSTCEPGFIEDVSNYLKNTGVIDEEHYPWDDQDHVSCNQYMISTGEYRMTIGNWYPTSFLNNDVIKQAIITRGPLVASIEYFPNSPTRHCMALLGFGTIHAGDIYHNRGGGDIFVNDSNENIGKLYWIFKQSYSPSFGDGGYVYHLDDQFGNPYFKQILKYTSPIDDVTNQLNETTECYDKDSDGYCFWGLGYKHDCENCENCPPDSTWEDCDDSNPRIGPYEADYSGKVIAPVMNVALFKEMQCNVEAENNGFLNAESFCFYSDTTFKFNIINQGNAQLNLSPLGNIVSLSGPDTADFHVMLQPDQKITFVDTTAFVIKYTGDLTASKIVKITIAVNEQDIPHFSFTLIYNGCSTLDGYDSINTEVEWSGSYRTQSKDLHIQNNGILTITDTVMLSPEADIIIERGGKLILDGGRLTRLCDDELWNGIQVWGDSAWSQYPLSNQGYLEINHGGIIEYAKAAVFVGKTETHDTLYAASGGVIAAEDALFLNNELDVEFLPFINHLYATGPEIPNASRFRHCVFKTHDPDFLVEKVKNHVILDGVNGVDFFACSFITQEIDGHPIEETNKGTGILALDAQVYVKGYCTSQSTPCPGYDSCYFTNLRYGIRAFGTGGFQYLDVSESVFDENTTGIYLSGYHQPSVVSSWFKTRPGHEVIQGQEDAFYGGLFMEGSSGYTVENNYFAGPNAAIPDSGSVIKIGLYVKNSGEDDNEIYNNFFTGLDAGIVAEGINKGEKTGLCLKCNDFRTCLNDMMVTDSAFYYRGKGAGIKENQGADTTLSYMLAGNTFTPEVQGIQAVDNGGIDKYFWSYFNNADHFNYYHHGDNIHVVTYPPDSMNYSNNEITFKNKQVDYDKSMGCPINPSSPGYKSMEDPRLEKIAADIQLATLHDTYDSLLDGGNTDDLDFEIVTSMPDEALELHDQLLSDSPYLSDTILKQAIYKETVLPNAMIRDVLTANPQSAKSSDIMDAVEGRFDPMPDYMKADIMQGLDQIGALESLESKIGYWENYRTQAVNELIREFISDTTLINPKDSLINLIEDEISLESKYRLAFAYWDNNQPEQTHTLLTDIPYNFELSTTEQAIHEEYIDYFEVLQTLKDSNLNIRQLDSSHVQNLITIMNSGLPLISVYARGLLIKGKYIGFTEFVSFPSQVKSYPAYYYLKPSKTKFSEEDDLVLFPNPCGDYVITYFNTLELNQNGILIIYDLQGREMDRITLHSLQNQQIINISNYADGSYLIQLSINHQPLDSKLLVKGRK